MKTKEYVILAVSCWFLLMCARVSHAHIGGHGNLIPLNPEEVMALAIENIDEIILRKIPVEDETLGRSWKNIRESNRKIVVDGEGYYIISVTNSIANKTLYLLLTDYGELFDANFSGEFGGYEE